MKGGNDVGWREEDEALAARLASMDGLDQCSFLLDESLRCGPPPDGLCEPEYRIPGCQITIWARIRPHSGSLLLECASDSLLAGAVLHRLCEWCAQLPPAQLADRQPAFLRALDDMVIAPEIRHNGIAKVLQMVRAAARRTDAPPKGIWTPEALLAEP